MKFLIRSFFKTLRVVLGPVILIKERLSRPAGLVRAQAAQTIVDKQCERLALYHYKTCPFCMKVRQEMHRLTLPIQRIDAQPQGSDRQALQQGGGLAKVPCLKITDAAGSSQWLYDSDKIVAYLRGRFADSSGNSVKT
ncbi:MAG: glutathione S-transferase N-terminal domain-containing protein [Polaromonas sp.]|jgi:glutaredoxin|nr:glutathione S-transferase N-terminal domain-containing protein [Polaromonas sp.]